MPGMSVDVELLRALADEGLSQGQAAERLVASRQNLSRWTRRFDIAWPRWSRQVDCGRCGVRFTCYHNRRVAYCSARCKADVANARKRRDPVVVRCGICREPFETAYARQNNYCEGCRARKWTQYKVVLTERICEHCGEAFMPNRLQKERFCSPRCVQYAWVEKNREHVSAYAREWSQSPAQKAKQHERDQTHEARARRAAYMKTPAGKAAMRVQNHRRRTSGRWSKGLFDQLMLDQHGRCAGSHCRAPFSEAVRAEMDHVLPVARGGTNSDDNAQLLCMTCNRSKGAKTMAEWATL